MPGVKIDELTAAADVAPGDLIPVVDVSTDETKAVTRENFGPYIYAYDDSGAAPDLTGLPPGLVIAYDASS